MHRILVTFYKCPLLNIKVCLMLEKFMSSRPGAWALDDYKLQRARKFVQIGAPCADS